MSDGVLWEYNAAEDEAIVPLQRAQRAGRPDAHARVFGQRLRAGHGPPGGPPPAGAVPKELRRESRTSSLSSGRGAGGGEHRWHRAEGVTLCGADGRPARTGRAHGGHRPGKAERLRLRDAAERDPMTGLYNRSVVQRLIDERFEQDPPVRAGSLFVVDIDNFKAVNDRLGHLFGDVLLTNIAKAMRETVRPGDILGRIGGDEFVVFLPGASRAEGERIAGELGRARLAHLRGRVHRPANYGERRRRGLPPVRRSLRGALPQGGPRALPRQKARQGPRRGL